MPKGNSAKILRASALALPVLLLSVFGFSATHEIVLYRFTGGYDGGIPDSGLIFGSDGNLYGTTSYGGNNVFYGAVFELILQNGKWKEHVIYNFKGGKDGNTPLAKVTFDSRGNIFGTTGYGGAYDFGTVFELTPNNGKWKKRILYSFKGSTKGDGQYPWAGVIIDKRGNLYGTTQLGGPGTQTCPSGCGTVYQWTPSGQGWKENVLYSFTGQDGDGAGASSGLLMDADGSLFGTTEQGGSSGYGTVYELRNLSHKWREKVLYQFTGSGDGSGPNSGLIMDKSRGLYGTTNYGGSSGWGTVFEVKASGGRWTESVLYSFSTGAGFPGGNLVFDASGNLYGSESAVGCCGAVFEMVPLGNGQWSESTIYQFTGNTNKDGSTPNGALIFDSAENLYGTTSMGGYGPCWGGLGCGVIFELTAGYR